MKRVLRFSMFALVLALTVLAIALPTNASERSPVLPTAAYGWSDGVFHLYDVEINLALDEPEYITKDYQVCYGGFGYDFETYNAELVLRGSCALGNYNLYAIESEHPHEVMELIKNTAEAWSWWSPEGSVRLFESASFLGLGSYLLAEWGNDIAQVMFWIPRANGIYELAFYVDPDAVQGDIDSFIQYGETVLAFLGHEDPSFSSLMQNAHYPWEEIDTTPMEPTYDWQDGIFHLYDVGLSLSIEEPTIIEEHTYTSYENPLSQESVRYSVDLEMAGECTIGSYRLISILDKHPQDAVAFLVERMEAYGSRDGSIHTIESVSYLGSGSMMVTGQDIGPLFVQFLIPHAAGVYELTFDASLSYVEDEHIGYYSGFKNYADVVWAYIVQARQTFIDEFPDFEANDPAGTATPKIGDVIDFGKYTWQILEERNGKLLLITKDSIDMRVYDDTYQPITWETSTIRAWLNNEFLRSFTEEERAKIQTTTVENPNNQEYSTFGGSTTHDKVFLLSIEEVQAYFSTDSARTAALNLSSSRIIDLAAHMGNSPDYKNTSEEALTSLQGMNHTTWWWRLRSPGKANDSSACVSKDGNIDAAGMGAAVTLCGIRPSLWISLDIETVPVAATKEIPIPSPPASLESFSILGDWTQTWGEGSGGISWSIYNGRTVSFSQNGKTNLYSPMDSYRVTSLGGDLLDLGITGLLGDHPDYTARIVDANQLEIYSYGKLNVILERVNPLPLPTAPLPKSSTPEDRLVTLVYHSEYDSGVVEDILWGASLFQRRATDYSNDLALLAAALCTTGNFKDDAVYLCNAYETLDFLDYAVYSYPNGPRNQDHLEFAKDNSYAFSIGHCPMMLDGTAFTLITITVRGTKTAYEMLIDGTTGANTPFLQQFMAYDGFVDFMNDIWDGLYDYYGKHPELETSNIKFLIAGHSIGGAAANLLAADLVHAQWAGKEDVYAYTFGALNSITTANARQDYENVHNIFNTLDSFGANSTFGTLKGKGDNEKLGVMHFFTKNYAGVFSNDGYCDHVIESYLDAVKNGLVEASPATVKTIDYSKAVVSQEHLDGMVELVKNLLVLCERIIPDHDAMVSLDHLILASESTETYEAKVQIHHQLFTEAWHALDALSEVASKTDAQLATRIQDQMLGYRIYAKDENAKIHTLFSIDKTFDDYEAVRAYGEALRTDAEDAKISYTFTQADLEYARTLLSSMNMGNWQLTMLMQMSQEDLGGLYRVTRDAVSEQVDSPIREEQIEVAITNIQKRMLLSCSSELVHSLAMPVVRVCLLPNMYILLSD